MTREDTGTTQPTDGAPRPGTGRGDAVELDAGTGRDDLPERTAGSATGSTRELSREAEEEIARTAAIAALAAVAHLRPAVPERSAAEVSAYGSPARQVRRPVSGSWGTRI